MRAEIVTMGFEMTAAIGGISVASMPRVRETGAAMAAVISACYAGDDPVSTARALVDAWNQ